MKSHLLLTTIAAVLLVGCGQSQRSAPAPESKPVEPVVKAAKPKTPSTKAPDISIHKAAKGNIEAVKQHLAAGTDVSAKNKYGQAPLHYAAIGSHCEVIELLLVNGVDVNAKNSGGFTALHFSAWYGLKETVELLLANDADINAVNGKGQTPLYLAVSNQRTAVAEGNRAYGKTLSETADLLRKHGGKTGEELKAAGN
jgi:ankyrin repeat protein